MEEIARRGHATGTAGEDLLGPDFARSFVPLHDRFGLRVATLRRARRQAIEGALHQGRPPRARSRSEANGDLRVPPLPEAVCRPGIESSGPISITTMAIDALDPEPEGVRAVRHPGRRREFGRPQLRGHAPGRAQSLHDPGRKARGLQATLVREVFDHRVARLPHPCGTPIRAIALAWIRRMAELDFRSLGSFWREALRGQAASAAL